MTNLFLTTTDVSAVTPGGAETTRWRLAGVIGPSRSLNKNTVAGPTAPILVTDATGTGLDGNTVAWYTDPLVAVTIAGQVVASLWGVESATAANAAPCIGIYACDNTGLVISTIADPASVGSQGGLEFATTAGAKTCTISAANVTDTALAAGQRLKITLCIDDAADQGGSGSMASGRNIQYTIGGATGSTGQCQIAFTETLISGTLPVAFPAVAGKPATPPRPAPSILPGF